MIILKKLQLKQKLQDNYATLLKFNVPEKMELNLVNKLLSNSFEFNLKAKAPIISRSADYRARVITSWKSEGREYLVGASYSHNIRDISFFKLVPSKMTFDGKLSKNYDYGSAEVSVGQYGTSSLSYDFNFSDNEGRFQFEIPNQTRHTLVIKSTLENGGFQLSSAALGHIVESSGSIQCDQFAEGMKCAVSVNNLYRSPSGKSTVGNFKGDGLMKNGLKKTINTNMVANVIGYTVKINQQLTISDDEGIVRLTWNLADPTGQIQNGKYVRLGARLKLPKTDARATGQFDLQL